MDFNTWPDKLSDALKENPRAAFSYGAVAVIVWLASCIIGLVAFIRSQNQTTLDDNKATNKELKAQLIQCEAKYLKLDAKYDSVVVVVGDVRNEALRKEIILKDQNIAELTAFKNSWQVEKEDMARELRALRNASVTTRRLSETVKTITE